MRLLADENISPVIVAALAAAGHDAVSATTLMPGAPDDAVMARAFAETRILVSEDKDFGELAFKHGYRSVGVIRLALPGFTPAQKAARLCEVLAAAGGIAGRAVVIEPDRLRSRALPKS